MTLPTLKQILCDRDGLSDEEAAEVFNDAFDALDCGEDPEYVCADYFGVEPDFVAELLERAVTRRTN